METKMEKENILFSNNPGFNLHVRGCILNKRVVGSLSLFFFIFIFLGIIFTQYGFDIDDCGILFRAQIKNVKNVWSYFFGMDLYSSVFPSNFSQQIYTFFNAFYRPLIMLFLGIQTFFFGNVPYCYFLVAICFHALNVVLLFNIFYTFSPSFFWAFIGALFVGVHISLASWLGWIAAQVYQIGLFFLLVSLILFWSHLKNNSWLTYILSCFVYGIAVFTFEINVVYPMVIVAMFYMLKEVQPSIISVSQFDYLKKTLGFWFVAIFFLIVKFINYPRISIAQYDQSIMPLWHYIKSRFYDGVTLFAELANMSFFPSGNQIIKGVGISFFCAILIFLFVKNKQKKLILLYVFCFCIYLWPAFIRYYTSRHLYFSLPFFALVLITLIIDYDSNSYKLKNRVKKIGGFCLICIVAGNFFFLKKSLSYAEKRTRHFTNACIALVNNPELSGKTLCFIGVPRTPFRYGLAQTLWLLGFDISSAIYYDLNTLFDSPFLYYSDAFKVSPVKNGYYLRSTDKNICWPEGHESKGAMGRKIIHNVDKKMHRIYEMTYVLDEKYQNQDIVFISWDFMTWQFKILSKIT